MWIVKLGGSLAQEPQWLLWLEMLAELGRGRVTIVCGGGSFADEVRQAQARWQFDDLAAHNMAVLAMAQSAYMAHGLLPSLRLATRRVDLLRVLHAGHTALWLPLDKTSPRPTPDTSWDNSADSMALELAITLNAERLVLVKSCPLQPALPLADLGQAGVLDRSFVARASRAVFPIDLVHKDDVTAVRSWLIGEGRGSSP
ncbi:MAG: aspartate kinase [Burkholderiaceae bacterium]|nr:aspartate kinase [Burkholderiaceae bacterium]